jgi:sec-independent protein translocase protein TatA
MMGISIWQLLIILLIVVVLFGTKKLRNIGADLGSAIKNFRASMHDGDADKESQTQETAKAEGVKDNKGKIFEGQITDKQVTPDNTGKIFEGKITDKQVNKAV